MSALPFHGGVILRTFVPDSMDGSRTSNNSLYSLNIYKIFQPEKNTIAYYYAYKIDFQNNSNVVAFIPVAQETLKCLVYLRCSGHDYALEKTPGSTNYSYRYCFLQNLLCLDDASSSFRVVNLKVPN